MRGALASLTAGEGMLVYIHATFGLQYTSVSPPVWIRLA
jgi:hypothetical protein